MFFKPTAIPTQTTQLNFKSSSDSFKVLIRPGDYQPSFLKSNNDTVEFDFSIESFVFESLSGNKLNGWRLRSKSQNPSVSLLHFHGNSGFLLNQYKKITPLIQHGFQIFMFDYSGYGFSEGKATRQNVLLDANSALNYFKTRPETKGTKLVIYGQSLGGHLSAVVASQRQAEIDGLVIEGAFSSHKDIAAESAGILGRIFVGEKYSAVKSIRKIKKPLLVIYSTEDEVIPFNMGKKLFDNANEPKELFEIKKCHICGPQFYAEVIAVKIMNMLK